MKTGTIVRSSRLGNGIGIRCGVGLVSILVQMLILTGGAQDIHHNLPDNLEIIDPKSLGLSGTDLENFLGNVKLLPIGDTFGGGASGLPKAQILTVGFDGNEQLNLEDFAALSSDGLADSDKTVAEMAFKKFKDFFKNPGAAQNFDEIAANPTNSAYPDYSSATAAEQSPTPTAQSYQHQHTSTGSGPLGSSDYDQERDRDRRPKKKRVRVNKRPVLFSSTFKSVDVDEDGDRNVETTTTTTSYERPTQHFQDYARVIQEMQTKRPAVYRDESRRQNATEQKFQSQRQNQYEGQRQDPKPQFEPPQKPQQQNQNQQHQQHQQQQQPLTQHDHKSTQLPAQQIQIAYPTPYFVAPSGPPSQTPYFPQAQATPSDTTSVHVQHHYNPVHEVHHQNSHSQQQQQNVQYHNQQQQVQHNAQPQQRNPGQNNFLQQQSQYFPILPVPTNTPKQPQQYQQQQPAPQQQQQQQQYLEYQRGNFLTSPTETRHQQSQVPSGSGVQNQTPAQSQSQQPNLHQHVHNRFHVPQAAQPQPQNHNQHEQQHRIPKQQQQHYAPPIPGNVQYNPPPPPPPSTTPRSHSAQGIFQVTPSMGLIPMATVENAMNAYKSRQDRAKAIQNFVRNPPAQNQLQGNQNQHFPQQQQQHQQQPQPQFQAEQQYVPKPQPQQPQQNYVAPAQHQQNHNNHNHQNTNQNFPPQPQPPTDYFPAAQQQNPVRAPQFNAQQPQPHQYRQESQEYKQHALPPQPTSFQNFQGPNFRVPAPYQHNQQQQQQQPLDVMRPPPPPPASGPSSGPGPAQNFQNTRQQSTLGNLLAPIGQRFQAFANRFRSNPQPPPPPSPQAPQQAPKLVMRQPPTVNFRGAPAELQFKQVQNQNQNPSGNARPAQNPNQNNNIQFQEQKGFQFQTSPSTYHPVHFQKQQSAFNFRQTPIPPTAPAAAAPLIIRSPQPQHVPTYFQNNQNTQPLSAASGQIHYHHAQNQPRFQPSQPDPQSGQLKYPEPNAIAIHHKSNLSIIPSPTITDQHQQQQHHEANAYTQALGFHVQSITTAPLISSFSVQSKTRN